MFNQNFLLALKQRHSTPVSLVRIIVEDVQLLISRVVSIGRRNTSSNVYWQASQALESSTSLTEKEHCPA